MAEKSDSASGKLGGLGGSGGIGGAGAEIESSRLLNLASEREPASESSWPLETAAGQVWVRFWAINSQSVAASFIYT